MGNANRSSWLSILAVGALAAAMPGTLALAQAPDRTAEVFPLPGGEPLPDMPPETTDAGRVRNVSKPTLTVFHPAANTDAHVAIIIAPGGGFEHLSMGNEGIAVARRLAASGVTAIVLKYRLARSMPHTSAPPAMGPGPQVAPAQRADAQNSSPAALRAMADGDAAVAFVRAHANDLGISPHRVGFLGFSAGAVIAMHVTTNPDPVGRPDFAAAIYGAMPRDAVVPALAPPLFLAVAADDKLVGPARSLAIFDAWHAAGNDVELHVFQSGGHGFGMTARNTTSDHWIDEYVWWLELRGILPRAGSAHP